MNSPFGPNSSNCAAAGAYAGPPALLERVKTKTCPFELTATPETSPKFIPAGSFKKSGTESNWISGAVFDPSTLGLPALRAGAASGGSMPLFLIAGRAAGEVRNAISAFAAAGDGAFAAVPAEKIVARCTPSGIGPVSVMPGTGNSSLICWKPTSASPRATTAPTRSPSMRRLFGSTRSAMPSC